MKGTETSSLSFHGSSGYNSHDVLSVSTWSDSGYYGNWEMCSSPDYEPMTGSNPIAIPFTGNQAFDRSPREKSPLSYSQQLTFDDREPTSPRRPAATVSPGSDSCHDQQSRPGSVIEGFPIVMDNSDPRPPLPPKKGKKGTKSDVKNYQHDFKVSEKADSAGGNNPYEYIEDNIYEDISAHRPQLIPGDPQIPHSSSPTSIYSNDEVLSYTNNLAYRSLPDGNSGNERESPPTLPPPRKGNVNRACTVGLGVFRSSACLQKDSRCSSLSAIDAVQERFLGRAKGRKANSFSCVGQRDRAIFMKGKAKLVDSISLEAKLETSSEPTYENIDSSFIPVSDNFLRIPGSSNPELRPALPKKRQAVTRTYSEPRKTHTHDRPHCDDSTNPCQRTALNVGPWILRNSSLKTVRRTAHAENSENLRLRRDVQSNDASTHAQMKNIEARGRASGCEDFYQFRESFREISSDYADLDAIWGKLSPQTSGNAESSKKSQNESPREHTKLKNSFSDCQINTQSCASAEMIAAWKRLSVDPDLMSRYNFSTPENGIVRTNGERSSSLQREAAKKTDVLQSQLAHASMVTAV